MLPVLSPISILPSLSCHCTFIPATTISALFKNIDFLLWSSSEGARLKMCDLQLRKSRNVCTRIRTKLTCFLVSYLFVIYFTTLVVPQITHCDVIGLLANMDWKSRRICWGLIWGFISSFVCMDRGQTWKTSVRLHGWLARMLNGKPPFIKQCKSFEYFNRLTLYGRRNKVLCHIEEVSRQTLTTSPSFRL